MRGNSEAEEQGLSNEPVELNAQVPTSRVNDPAFTQNLRFGDGRLLRDGTADFVSEGRSLQGRYIVRVGWDDVRSWLAEVRFIYLIRFIARDIVCVEGTGLHYRRANI